MAERRAVLIVDGANWAHALGGEERVNFDTLVGRLQHRTGLKIVGLTFYTAFRTERDLDRRWPFLTYLKELGWQVNAMPATFGADHRWRDKEVDVAIALDAYEEAISGKIDAVMIGSGDEDFAALFRRLPAQVEGWVVSFQNKLSSALRKVAKVVLVEDLGVVFKHQATPAS